MTLKTGYKAKKARQRKIFYKPIGIFSKKKEEPTLKNTFMPAQHHE